ncbi:MAG: PhoU domain-containing protein [Candidatus Krumholzibacteriia bacterium]
MDFKSIMSLFREDDWTRNLVEKLDEMLMLSGAIFDHALGVVLGTVEDVDPKEPVYDRDKRINKLMRKIRRRVVARLSIDKHGAEVPTALIFMNAVKDAERIGDYGKNLYEIAAMQPDTPDADLYQAWLGPRGERISDLMDRTRKAFARSDDTLAARVIADSRQLGRECEEAIREITATVTSVRDAVALVLALRFYKRIVGHLSNIATTVVMPVDMLDFHDED